MEKLMEKIANAFAKALVVAAEKDQSRFNAGTLYYKDNIGAAVVNDKLKEEKLLEVINKAFKIAANNDESLMSAASAVFTEEFAKIPSEAFTMTDKEADVEPKTEPQTEPKAKTKAEPKTEKIPTTIGHKIFIGVVVFLVIAGIIAFVNFVVQDNAQVKNPVAKTATTWEMTAADYGQNRWFSDGVQEIKDAKTDTEAADAAQAWLEKVKLDPALLAGAAQYFLDEKVDPSTLVKDNWATQEAVKLYSRLSIALSMAKVDVTEAPADGINSGVADGQVVQAANAGISGDRKAIRATLDDGTVIYIMGRCGNPVTTTTTTVPEGPTDNPPDWIGDGTPNIVPKSSDPDDYKQPGDDNVKDSGKGTKPIVPEVTKKAESSAPEVDSSVKLNDEIKITEKVTKDSGDETGIPAEDADIAGEERNSNNIPDAEEEVNPGKSNNGTNEDTINEPTFTSN